MCSRSLSSIVLASLMATLPAGQLCGQVGVTPGFDAPDYAKYPAGLAGYTGVNLNEIVFCTRRPAIRARIGHRGLYKTGLARLPGGDLFACPCYHGDDKKWHITIFHSQDDGKTWAQIKTHGDPLLGKEPAIVVLPPRGLLLLTSHPHGFRVSRSHDGGVTWKTTRLGEGYSTVRNLITAPNGGLLLLMSKGAYYNRAAPPSQSWLFRSTDGGKTWRQDKKLKVWNDPESMFDEVSIARLPDGRLLAAGRVSGDHRIGNTPPPRGIPTPVGDESGDHMVLTESADGGKTWSMPRPLTSYSEVHAHLLVLRDGRLLCSYASYHLPYGVFAMLSADGGKTWDTQHPIQLALSMTCYTGWPTSLELPDGDILTAYAATGYVEGQGVTLKNPGKRDTVTEVVRWQLPPRPSRPAGTGG